ncbi:MAG: DUF4317 domain-containing protein [Clostridia bacterium]|nr:DUF4317 domain-containing protein [Clostridia bacterium]
MNKKDISEIRKRLNPESHNPIEIRGCYVNGNRAVISAFHRPLISLPETEADSYMQIFKRILSGDVGKNLMELHFPVDQVMEGEEHGRLTDMNKEALLNDDTVNDFFTRIIESTQIEGNYLILVMHDAYDVPVKSSDGELESLESDNVFSYLICAVCPVKQSKAALSYIASENDFHSKDPDWVVAPPEMGFMFPAYEDRGPNIHKALFYTKDLSDCHADFTDAVLKTSEVIPAAEQKEAFQSLLVEALEDECSMEVVQAVNEQINRRLEEQKSDKEAEPARITKREVSRMLTECGVSDTKTEAFEKSFDDTFGLGMDIPAASIANERQFEVRTPDVVVRVSPDRAGLIETRVIDGIKYILIRADEGVTVNGMSVGI